MLEIQQKGNMISYIDTLQNCLLFEGIKKEDLLNLLGCLNARVKKYKKDEIVLEEGGNVTFSGIVLAGSLQTEQYDYLGNRTILARIEPVQLFGEAFYFSKEKVAVNIVAAEDSCVLLFNSAKISSPCQNHCLFHIKLINNLLQVLATNNIALNQKIQCISQRTTREKLLNYLASESKKQNSNEFFIPYDRQSLADYLCVERSAMSVEISKLRNEKILECTKNKFKFL